MATFRGIPLSKISPAFLHANSTSHTWAFSAFAELIDNAYDPDVSASELLIDKIDINRTPCLIFLDNGAGMDSDHLLKMLSFGYCEKQAYERSSSHMPIGHYGNGFKSGSMRLGKDALVFTRCHDSASIGFLSQTYLKEIGTDSVVVPILTYRLPKLERVKSQESRNNLDAILKYSVFHTEQDLKEELLTLEGSVTGTKIILSNLKKLQDSRFELDFSSDETDIRCPEAHEVDLTSVYHRPIQQPSSEYKHSLKEYCSILFLRPRMKITIRGQRVRSRLISKSLSQTEFDSYKPTWMNRPLKITFGFTCEKIKSEDYGMMLYHRNRLIKAFEKVGYQKQPNDLGVGVVGVAQVDFLQPTHNKQDFNKDEKFNSVMAAFSTKLNDYWNEKKQHIPGPTPVVLRSNPDWLWAQCEQCLKWRRLPDGVRIEDLPNQWFCRLNPDPTHNRCEIPEEPEDEDLAIRPTYEKTFKRKQEERKRQQTFERQREEELKKQRMMAREKELKQKEAELMAIQRARNKNIPMPMAPRAQQHPSNQGALTTLQRELAESQKREERQKRMLMQIDQERKLMNERKKSILQLAESLKAGKGENSEDVLKEMSSLLGVPRNEAVSQSPLKRKQEDNTGSSPRGNKRPFIKEEVIDSQPNTAISSSSSTPFNAARQISGAKASNHESSPSLNRSVSPPSVSSTPIKGAQQNDAQDGTTPGKEEKRNEKAGAGTDEDVIDLTLDGDSDVKPNMEALKYRQRGSEHDDEEDEDVKPDKEDLDASMKNDSNEKSQEAGRAAAHKLPPKKEPQERKDSERRQDKGKSLSDKGGKAESTDTPRFGPSEDDPEFQMGPPDTFHSNLEAAMAAIMEKMNEEKDMESEEGPVKPRATDEDANQGRKDAKVKIFRERDNNISDQERPDTEDSEDNNFDDNFDDDDEDDREMMERRSLSPVHDGKSDRDSDRVVAQILDELVANAVRTVRDREKSFDDDEEDYPSDDGEEEDCEDGRHIDRRLNSDGERMVVSDEKRSTSENVKESPRSGCSSEEDSDIEGKSSLPNGKGVRTLSSKPNEVTENGLDSERNESRLTKRRVMEDSKRIDEEGFDDEDVSDDDDARDSSPKSNSASRNSSREDPNDSWPVSPCKPDERKPNSSMAETKSKESCQTLSDPHSNDSLPLNFLNEPNSQRRTQSETASHSRADCVTTAKSSASRTRCSQFTQTSADAPGTQVGWKCADKCLLNQYSQTEEFSGNQFKNGGEKIAMQETIDNLRIKQEVKSQLLEKAEDRVESLCENVHKLLSFILSDVNLGAVKDTEQMLKNLIRSHEESLQNTQEGMAESEKSLQNTQEGMDESDESLQNTQE